MSNTNIGDQHIDNLSNWGWSSSLPAFFLMVAYLGVNMSLWFGLKSPYNQIGFMGKENKTKQKKKKRKQVGFMKIEIVMNV